MFRKVLLASFVALCLCAIALGQTFVLSGEGTLREAIDLAAPGDVLALESGGIFTENTRTVFTIDKPLTIMAEEGATVPPVIKMTSVAAGTGDKPSVFRMANGGSLTLMGLEFNGMLATADTAQFEPTANLFYWPVDKDQAVGNIKVYSCYVHNMTNKIFAGYDSDLSAMQNVTVDTLIFENCLFYYVQAIKARYVPVKYLKVENCTFWDMPDFGIYFRDFPIDEVFINHCTFHNVGTTIFGNSSEDNMVIFRTCTIRDFTCKNSIFSTSSSNEPFWPRDCTITGTAVVSNLCFFNTVAPNYGGITPTGILDNTDPKFADSGTGDFTLAADSPCQGAADDGLAMGDLRWGITTAVKELSMIPVEYDLAQNYPNPFNPSTTIRFSLIKPAHTVLTVYNMMGQPVTVLVNRKLGSGVHEIHVDASGLGSGMYFYRIQSGDFMAMRKMLLMK